MHPRQPLLRRTDADDVAGQAHEQSSPMVETGAVSRDRKARWWTGIEVEW
jgi:hypothetical protein